MPRGILHPSSYAAGIIGGIVALGFSVVLSVQSIAGLSLPGCGPQSACAQATSSVFGRLPIIGWPVSHLGTGYFLGAALLWIASQRGMGVAAIWLYRLGALVSLVYVGIILTNPDLACPYCLGAHSGNFLLLISAEWRRVATASVPPARPLATRKAAALWGGGFIATTALLAVLTLATQQDFEAAQESERRASEGQLSERIAQQQADAEQRQAQRPDPSGARTFPSTADAGAGQAGTTHADGTTTGSLPAPTLIGPGGAALDHGSRYGEHNPFVGRFVKGPDEAPIRIVVFSGFQCADCKRIDGEIGQLKRQFGDRIAFSHKHFPFHTDCNPFTPRTLHENACWAARVAEIAGMIGGAEAFYRMHDWLYEVDGRFISTQDLQAGVARSGIDWTRFSAVMNDRTSMEEVNRRIEGDVREGIALGLHMTPMIFINGVELRGFRAPRAVTNTVTAALNQDPRPLGFWADRPITANEKAIELFAEDMAQSLPLPANDFARGPAMAPISVQIWGSHAREEFREALREILRLADRRGDVRVILRHYPLDGACNPHMRGQPANNECEMARMLDAAGIVGGQEAYWSLSGWLLANAERYTQPAALEHLRSIGVDPGAVVTAMADQARNADIQRDIEQLRTHMRVQGVPGIFINGRHASMWRGSQREPILDALIDAASGL